MTNETFLAIFPIVIIVPAIITQIIVYYYEMKKRRKEWEENFKNNKYEPLIYDWFAISFKAGFITIAVVIPLIIIMLILIR
ncbi:MAG: hypothetical protein EAZ55_00730 [Cytophagales bacterium]|nr:MAG: hypothetical protein EAZ55_00730 [Cytophagales bacterium]